MTSKIKNYLFVYGTLRKGFKNPILNEVMDNVKFIENGFIQASLFDIGEYPGIVPNNDKKSVVKGDVFEINDSKKVFKILDNYEGFYIRNINKSEYLRSKALIELSTGNKIIAWVYWYNFSVEGKQKINNSDYLEYLEQKLLPTNL